MPPASRRFSGAANAGSKVRLPMRVWDLPTRLFHAIATVLIAVGAASANLAGYGPAWTQAHLLSAYALATLLLFRLGWGLAGSETARFGNYLRSPFAGLRAPGSSPPDDVAGHGAAGGWVVLAMLALLAASVTTDLLSDPASPFARHVGTATRDALATAHATSFELLLGFLALHLLVLAAHAARGNGPLLRPIVTGKRRLPAATRAPRMASLALAGLVLAAAAAVMLALVAVA